MKKISIRFLFATALVLFTSSMAFASHTIVKCWAANNTRQFVQLKVDMSGNLTMWSETQVGQSDNSRSIFTYFSQDTEMFEGISFFKGKNGYAMVRLMTTADAVTLGVSPDMTKGFYNYEDHGSGAGANKLTLTCQPMIALK